MTPNPGFKITVFYKGEYFKTVHLFNCRLIYLTSSVMWADARSLGDSWASCLFINDMAQTCVEYGLSSGSTDQFGDRPLLGWHFHSHRPTSRLVNSFSRISL